MEKIKLEEIAPIKQGQTIESNDNVWLLNLDMVESNTGKILDYIIVPKKDIGNSTIIFDSSNVLYSKLRPYLNKVVLPMKSGYATSEMLPLKPDTKRITREYLTYFLRSKNFVQYINSKTSGAKMPRANTQDLKNALVPCPSINEQLKTTSIFDAITKIIDLRKLQLEELDTLIKSRFVEMFGDPITNSKSLSLIPLGKACHMKAGKSIKACDISEDFEDGLYLCYGGNGIRGYVEVYTHEGDIPLIGRQGALCGNVQYASGKFYATEHAVVAQPKLGWNPRWLFIMLKEMNLNRLASGAAQPGLNVSTLVPLEVINPPIDQQDIFATFVQQVDKLKVEVLKSLDEMQILFDSLTQQYFG